jgi:hypothetical protein
VEANWKASALAAEAPAANSARAIAIAAYEHEEEAAPSAVARETERTPPPPIERSIRSRGTHAWTIAEMAKPSTSAHQTVHAISSAFEIPSQSVSSNPMAAILGRTRPQ